LKALSIVERSAAEPRTAPNFGSEFKGTTRFQICSRLGEGAVGVVYEAFDRETSAKVALKTLRSLSPETILLLKSEFRAVQGIEHPNLVHLGELFEDAGDWFFTMEFVQGSDFLRYVRRTDPRASSPGAREVPRASRFDEPRLRDALSQLVRGLRVLHGAQKVHRDVKPSNILVTDEGRVVLLDFGIASDLLRHRTEDEGPTGTVAYMAPEQAAAERVGPAADWYAVGVVLYEALTGRLPFEGTMHEIMGDKLEREPEPPHAITPDVPRDLDELCTDMLRLDPEERPTAADILRRLRAGDDDDGLSSSGQRSVFIGRHAELRALEQAFEDARENAVTVLVRGESGVGKSFLVQTFTEEMLTRYAGAELFTGRCYERESVPYKAVDGIVDDLTHLLKRLPDDEVARILPDNVDLLGQAFPVLGQIPQVTASLVPAAARIQNPQEIRARVFAALRQMLTRVAERQPTILQIDDLQWADADSLTLLADVMRPPHAPRLLLVATTRMTTESQRLVTGVQAAVPRLTGDVRHVNVEKLPPGDARELIARLLGSAANDAQLRAIADDAGGHPLFIDELVRQRSMRGADAAPVMLDDALWERVCRLDTGARGLLELVCVAGLPIQQEIAAHAAAIEIGQMLQLVSNLRAAHFARTSGMRRQDSIEPYHDRVRETVLARIDPATRKEWHGRLALALENAKHGDMETLAIHWQGAENHARAGEYALRAADEAAAALAFNRAVRLYRLAQELRPLRGTEERALKSKIAEALTNAGRGAEAGEMRLELARGANPIDSLDQRRRAAEQFLCSGHFDRGVEILREALAQSGVAFPRSPIAVIVSLIFFRIWLRFRGLAFKSRTAAQIDPGAIVRIDTARSAGAGFSMSDNIRGAYFQTRALLLALESGDTDRIYRSLAMEVCFTSAGGSRTRRRTSELLASLKAMTAAGCTPVAEALTHVAEGYYHYFLGEWHQTHASLEQAEAGFRDRCVGVTFELNSTRLMLYRALTFSGELRELAERVPQAFREVEEQQDRYSSINLRASPNLYLGLAADEPTRVRAELDQATQWLPQKRFLVQHYFCIAAQAQVDLYVDDAARAFERISAAWPALKRSMLLRVQSIRLGALDTRARCAIAAAAVPGQPREALLAVAEGDLALIAREDNVLARSYAGLLRASLAVARGDAAGALVHAADAARVCDASSMSLHAAAARWLQGSLLGDGGRELVDRARAHLEEQTVRAPRKMARIFISGIRDGE
jgi:hypothetical protein